MYGGYINKIVYSAIEISRVLFHMAWNRLRKCVQPSSKNSKTQICISPVSLNRHKKSDKKESENGYKTRGKERCCCGKVSELESVLNENC